jgi:hypothetical protein
MQSPAMIFILVIAVAVGALQIVLAAQAGVLGDFDTVSGLRGFGYLRSTHWLVSYLLIVPIVYLTCVTGIRSIVNDREDLSRHFRRSATIGLFLALAFVTWFVGGQAWRAFDPSAEDLSYCQWNTYAPQCAKHLATTGQQYFRLGLISLAYLNHFLSFGVYFWLLFTVMIAGWPADRPDRDTKSMTRATDLLKIATGGYFFYLILLRSAKTEMSIINSGQSFTCTNVVEFTKCAATYFEHFSEGLLFNVGLGAAVFLAMLYCQRIVIGRGSDGKTGSDPVAWLQSWEQAFWKLGRKFHLVLGIGMVGIIIPPPNAEMLTALALVLPGLFLLKKRDGQRGKED